ncbi:hypothetical protein LCL87_07755 [Rhodococcus hoagii]|nr:hypothetical protein [Prescottella equi]
MMIIDRVGPALAAVVGAFVAGFAILASEPNDTIVLEWDGGIWFHTTLQWAATVAAVTAVLVYVALRARASTAATVTATIAGACALALPAWMDVTTAQSVSLAGLGAGSLLGVGAFLVADRAAAGVAPAVGLIAALLFTPAVDALRPQTDRWLLSLDPYYPPAVVPVPALLVTVALIVGVALRCVPTAVAPPDRRLLFVGMGLPMLFLLVFSAVGSAMPDYVPWLIGVTVALVATLAATRLLPVPDAVTLMVGLAIAAAVVSDLGWFTSPPVGAVLVLGIVLLAAGVWAGRRRPAPVAALAVLTAVTATGLLPGDTVVAVTAYAVVLPLAAGFAFGSCRPVWSEAVLTAGMLPFTLTLLSVYVPVGEPDFGWTVFTPETPLPVIEMYVVNADRPVVAVAVAVALAATATTAVLVRRRTLVGR